MRSRGRWAGLRRDRVVVLARLHEHGPGFLRECAAMARLLAVDPDPVIVFMSDAPSRAADPGYVRHVHVWSSFRPALEVAAAARARRNCCRRR